MSNGIKRWSFEELGINKERYQELKAGCKKGLYDRGTLLQACEGFPEGMASFVIKSVTEDKTFEKLEFDERLGRLYVGKTNFYALRRQFYHNLDHLLTERGSDS